MNVRTQLSQTTYKHVLLPVFLANYRYNTKLYHFMVNGQTGEVQGQAPIDWIKVAIVVAIVLAILLVVLFVLSQADSGSGESLLPMMQYVAAMIQTHWAAGPPLWL